MKKEFKAPVVETKVLSAQEEIMDSVVLDLAKSGGQESASTNVLADDNKTNADFKQWKGFN